MKRTIRDTEAGRRYAWFIELYESVRGFFHENQDARRNARESPAGGLLRGLRNRLFGESGERAAVAVLRRAGLTIVARNVRNVAGEIDVLARDGATLVFVEVKTRKSSRAGAPVEAITRDKRTRLTRAALVELKRRGRLGRPCRFDVVSVTWPEGASEPDVIHYRHAFEATGVTSAFS